MDKSCQNQYERVCYPFSASSLPTSLRPIDTVRALHETVVCLRSALEESRKEVENLRKQINVQTDVNDGKIYHEKYDKHLDGTQLKPQATELGIGSKAEEKKSKKLLRKRRSKTPTNITDKDENISDNESNILTDDKRHTSSTPNIKIENPSSSKIEITSKSKFNENSSNDVVPPKVLSTSADTLVPDIKVTSIPSSSNNWSHKMMGSRIDVKIKVSSNINVDGNTSEAPNKEAEDSKQRETEREPDTSKDEESSERDDGQEESCAKPTQKEEFIKCDGKNFKINVSNEENLCVTKSHEGVKIKQLSAENLQVNVDDISRNNSISEGDNSVFTDGIHSPVEEENDDGDGNTSNIHIELDNDSVFEKTVKGSTGDHQEEVDDIELIFSSDDNKDIIQEDLVSISDYEPWQESGQSGTPILTKFSSLLSDQENIDVFTRKKAFSGHTKSMSCTTDTSSFDSTKRSLDTSKSTSLDQRDDTFDSFSQVGNSTIQKKWTNLTVLVETDISKCGIGDESILDKGRRNTCPNPTPYRPIIHSQSRQPPSRSPLAVKFSRSPLSYSPQFYTSMNKSSRPGLIIDTTQIQEEQFGTKKSSAAQTDISALSSAHLWRSETNLGPNEYGTGLFTLPSKFTAPSTFGLGRYPLRLSDKTQEARRVLLSDINFTSMVPELSRSADHLCQKNYPQNNDNTDNNNQSYIKGNSLKTPDFMTKGMPTSYSTSSQTASEWTVNENSFGTQTIRTGDYWGKRDDSFDSTKSYSIGSKQSSGLSKHHRSRSVPSFRCSICKQNHQHATLRPSESMHYTPRVTFQEPSQKIRGSLPDLRHDCHCPRRLGGPSMYRIHGDSAGSTESLLEEADEFIRRSCDGSGSRIDIHQPLGSYGSGSGSISKAANRRCSENDIQRDYIPSKQALPFLPKSPKCLKPGYLAKVIAKNGRIVVGRIRYIGPLACNQMEDETYVGLQLPNNLGDCDGTIEGRKFFDCERLHGLFVPFKKVVMAWNS